MKNPIYKQFIQYLENKTLTKKNKVFETKRALVLEMLYKVDRGEQLTNVDMLRLVNAVNVSALTGKLEDFYSVSTSPDLNNVCKCRAADKSSICNKCFSKASMHYKKELALALEINYIIFNCFNIPAACWAALAIPSINGKARIESHGDAGSIQGALNMNRVIESHSWLDFGVWTKNYYFWYRAFESEGKHKNCVFIVSSDKLNVVLDVPEYIKKYVDKVFTVYDFKTVKANDIKINCGLNHCKQCKKCYTVDENTYYISEILKKDNANYKKYLGIE